MQGQTLDGDGNGDGDGEIQRELMEREKLRDI